MYYIILKMQTFGVEAYGKSIGTFNLLLQNCFILGKKGVRSMYYVLKKINNMYAQVYKYIIELRYSDAYYVSL